MWIFLTLVATVLQTARNTLSKVMTHDLDRESVTLARFLFSVPVVGVITLIGWWLIGPTTIESVQFFLWAGLFAVMQLTANSIMLELFGHKNYAVSIAFIKSETVFIAVLGWLLIGEDLSPLGIAGMLLALAGVEVASLAKRGHSLRDLLAALNEKSALLGLLTGLCFGIGAVSVKHAFGFVSAPEAWQVSVFTLLIAVLIQSAILVPLQALRQPANLKRLFHQPLKPLALGTLSGLGSFFWFIAFGLTAVAYVKTIGQIEVALSILVSLFLFKEKITRAERWGIGLLLAGSSLLLWV